MADAAPDPFDLGDTSLQLTPKDERPRNPDGTFAAATPDTPTTPAPSKHPDYLVKRAEAFGMEPDEIAELTTTQLDRAVWRLVQQRDALREQNASQRQLDVNTVRTPPPPAPEAEEEAIDLGLNPD